MKINWIYLLYNWDQIFFSFIKGCFICFQCLSPDQLQYKLAELTKRQRMGLAMISSVNKKSQNSFINDITNIFGVVRTGDLNFVKKFIEKDGPTCLQSLDEHGFSVMHYVARDSTLEVAEYLCSLDIDYDNHHSNKNGQRPIHWAAVKGRIEMMNFFFEKGINVDVRDDRGTTPLILATQFGHMAAIAFLVGRGANIEGEDNNGDNALQWAVFKGYPDITRLLIIYGIEPKRVDRHGQTLLHIASLNGNLNIVQQLIESDSIDAEIRDNNGRKAIDIAKIRGFSDIVDYISRHNRDRKTQLFNCKTLLFGPVGNSKLVFLVIHALFWLYEYPLYFILIQPHTWEEMYFWHIIFMLNSIVMWIAYYMVHLKDPGYLKQNTFEYKSALRRITFKSQSFSSKEWQENLARLCHTCKCMKPYRASHCRACNRCVLAYDHHCPYIQNCVGYNNRPWFSLFVFTMATLQYVSLVICIFYFQKFGYDQYIVYPGAIFVVFFGIMVSILVFGSVTSAVMNLTGNEMAKREKYSYLKDSNGKFKNIFNKGVLYNIRYYYHLVEPSYLETGVDESFQKHIV